MFSSGELVTHIKEWKSFFPFLLFKKLTNILIYFICYLKFYPTITTEMKTNQEIIDEFSNTQKSPEDVQENCAFDGAMMALVPIADAAHLVHGPSGCIGTFLGNQNNFSDNSVHKIRFTTDMEESDIIFGGAKKLYKAIIEVQRRYNPTAIFVYSTCVSAMIGDDINGTCLDATEQLKIQVIPVDSPGFIGSKKSGTRLVSDILLEYVIGTAEPESTTEYDINLIGDNYETGGAIEYIQSLLKKVGIRVLTKITGNTSYKELCYAHRAKLNVIISSKALLKMAKKMETRFGIPYIEESFFSIEEINNCLRSIAAKLDSDLEERTEELIAEENNILNYQLNFHRSQFSNKRIILDIVNAKSWSIVSVAFFLDIDIIPIVSQKITQEDKARIQKLLGQNAIIIEQGNSSKIIEIIKENKADMLITRARYQYTAMMAQIPFLDINQENHRIYAGYAGILDAAQELYAAFKSPVWQQIRKPAIWE